MDVEVEVEGFAEERIAVEVNGERNALEDKDADARRSGCGKELLEEHPLLEAMRDALAFRSFDRRLNFCGNTGPASVTECGGEHGTCLMLPCEAGDRSPVDVREESGVEHRVAAAPRGADDRADEARLGG